MLVLASDTWDVHFISHGFCQMDSIEYQIQWVIMHFSFSWDEGSISNVVHPRIEFTRHLILNKCCQNKWCLLSVKMSLVLFYFRRELQIKWSKTKGSHPLVKVQKLCKIKETLKDNWWKCTWKAHPSKEEVKGMMGYNNEKKLGMKWNPNEHELKHENVNICEFTPCPLHS